MPNTSTFVPNDRSQFPYCVLPIMRCAFGARLDVGLAEWSTPCRFIGTNTFSSLISGKMTVFDRTLSGVCFVECYHGHWSLGSPRKFARRTLQQVAAPASAKTAPSPVLALLSGLPFSSRSPTLYNSISCISRKLYCMSDKNYSCVTARFSSRAAISFFCAASVAPRYSFNPMSMISCMSMAMTSSSFAQLA